MTDKEISLAHTDNKTIPILAGIFAEKLGGTVIEADSHWQFKVTVKDYPNILVVVSTNFPGKGKTTVSIRHANDGELKKITRDRFYNNHEISSITVTSGKAVDKIIKDILTKQVPHFGDFESTFTAYLVNNTVDKNKIDNLALRFEKIPGVRVTKYDTYVKINYNDGSDPKNYKFATLDVYLDGHATLDRCSGISSDNLEKFFALLA